jgi:hypothetical protein
VAIKFTAEFLEERMAQHRRFQHDLEAQWVHEIIDEVQSLPKRRPRSGNLFTMLPDDLQRNDLSRRALVRQ